MIQAPWRMEIPCLRHPIPVAALLATSFVPGSAGAQPADPIWLADRGPGVRTSIFGTYVRPGELLVSPFFEYYVDDDYEYSPVELGHEGDQDFRGRYRASEGLIFLSYGLTDHLAVELEAAVISASLEKAPQDSSTLPARIEESGRGDWQVQLDWRMTTETATRPEWFSFLEVVPPSNTSSLLIGTPDWEFKAGLGATRGWPWGTVTLRGAAEYSLEESALEVGEYAVEYLKRVSSRWRVYAGIEGAQDEVELIGEIQWHFSRSAYLRLNTAYGLTSKATDWAPDVGVMFSLPLGRAAAGD
jgi:hypothetical protein